jgi:hypothetical protein
MGSDLQYIENIMAQLTAISTASCNSRFELCIKIFFETKWHGITLAVMSARVGFAPAKHMAGVRHGMFASLKSKDFAGITNYNSLQGLELYGQSRVTIYSFESRHFLCFHHCDLILALFVAKSMFAIVLFIIIPLKFQKGGFR